MGNRLFVRAISLVCFVSASALAAGPKAPVQPRTGCEVRLPSGRLEQLFNRYVPTGSNGRAPAGAFYRVSAAGDVVQTLFEHSADVPQPIASTQKVVAAYVAIKRVPLDRRVQFTNADLDVDVLGARATYRDSGNNVEVGDSPTLLQYLNTLITESSNGAALAISRSINGDTRSFMPIENQEVVRLLGPGAKSFFQNPHGLTDEPGYERYMDSTDAQHSTASDLARLLGHFMADADYRSALDQAGLVGPSRGALTKGGSTQAAGKTLVFRFPLPGTACASEGVVGAVFGEGSSEAWNKIKQLYFAVQDEVKSSFSPSTFSTTEVAPIY